MIRMLADSCLRLRSLQAGLYRQAMRHSFTDYEERKLQKAMDQLEDIHERIEKRLEKNSAE